MTVEVVYGYGFTDKVVCTGRSRSSSILSQSAGDVVVIMVPWARDAYPSANVIVGYMSLVNASPGEVSLEKLDRAISENIELHEMVRVDELMKMRAVTDIVIPTMRRIQLKLGD